jgi:two-component SAPR family response regulator
MRILRYRFLFPIVIFSACILAYNGAIAQSLNYGLGFNSFEVVQEKRTSLNLSPSEDFSFSNGFSLSFNIFFHSAPEYNFGYVFRVIGQNNQHFDFLATPEKLTVVSSDDKVLAECLISEVSKNFSSFFPFQIDLDIKNDSLKITIGEKIFPLKVSPLKYFKEADIIFGKCDHPQFQTSDVPKMIIKDIRINDFKGEKIYYWKLSKHAEDGVYDELKNRFAKVENPQWLLDNHAFWNKRISFQTLKNPQITYNSDENAIAIADIRSFFIYNTLTNKLVKNDNSSGFVHSDQPNQLIYNPSDSAYYSYCFSKTEGSGVAVYNFMDKSWDNNTKELDSEFWHHNRFVSRKEDCLYLFGGYGQHTYKNQVDKYSFKTGKWDKLKYSGEQIPPRYLSGLGVIDENRILLFGGYGSNTGQQFLSPRNYYDLYQIDLPGLNAKKIWEMEPPKEPFVVANSMIVDTLNKCFYALCFPQNQYNTLLFLTKFSMQKPEYEVVSDSIPFYFNDILSYSDLFQNKKSGELYAVTFSSLSTDSLAEVSIYSLAYPPISDVLVYQQRTKTGQDHFHFLMLSIFILLFVFAIIAYWLLRKRKTKPEIEPEVEQPANEFPDEELKIVNQISERNKPQAIYLFGGFQVKDKKGNDITGDFSPMLRQLFLIILLNTFKEDGKGISSIELDDTLWPNKSHDSARNNRSVMTSKLRQLFDNVGQMNIESLNSYWIVKLGSEVYCDYREALLLIQNMKKSNNRTKEDVMKLLSIVSSGELLPNLQTEWVDPFKANFANELIDLLIEVSKQQNLVLSLSEQVYLADAILIYDILNDDALKLKCSSLVKMGKNGLAQATYNSFVKQYAVLFGAKYNYSFTQIIS